MCEQREFARGSASRAQHSRPFELKFHKIPPLEILKLRDFNFKIKLLRLLPSNLKI